MKKWALLTGFILFGSTVFASGETLTCESKTERYGQYNVVVVENMNDISYEIRFNGRIEAKGSNEMKSKSIKTSEQIRENMDFADQLGFAGIDTKTIKTLTRYFLRKDIDVGSTSLAEITFKNGQKQKIFISGWTIIPCQK